MEKMHVQGVRLILISTARLTRLTACRVVNSSRIAAMGGIAAVSCNDDHSRANSANYHQPKRTLPASQTHTQSINTRQQTHPFPVPLKETHNRGDPQPSKTPPNRRSHTISSTHALFQIMPSKRPTPPSTRGIKASSSNAASSASESLSSAYRALTAKENRSVVWSVSLFGVSGSSIGRLTVFSPYA